VVSDLIAPKPPKLDAFAGDLDQIITKPFNLVTFPEAFLPVETILSVLKALPSDAGDGCFHVGLSVRPATLRVARIG
jgi:hypothetical protein